MSDQDQLERKDEFLLEQYSALRNEVNGRILMRRRLIAALIAFTAAFLGFVFSSQESRPAWLLAILPFIVAFVATEILRSERMIKKGALFIQEIEEEFLGEETELGWETTRGGYARKSLGLSALVLIGFFVAFVLLALVGVLFWQAQPEQLMWVEYWMLLILYFLVFLIPAGFLFQVWRIGSSPKS